MAKKIEPIYIIGAAGMVGLGIFFMLRKQSPDTASTPPLSTWWWYDMNKIPVGVMPVYTPAPVTTPPVDATLPGPVVSPPSLSPVSPPGVWPPMPYPVFPPSDPTIPGPGVDSLAPVAKGGLLMGEVNRKHAHYEQFRPKRARIYSYLLKTNSPKSPPRPYGF